MIKIGRDIQGDMTNLFQQTFHKKTSDNAQNYYQISVKSFSFKNDSGNENCDH